MRKMGVDAKVAVLPEHLEEFRGDYPNIFGCTDLFVCLDKGNLVHLAQDASVVIATIFTSVKMLATIKAALPHVKAAYYVQDYEPLFFGEDQNRFHEAAASYDLVPDTLRFAKTDWICREVFERHRVRVERVIPSIDHDVYHPRARGRPDGKVGVVAMIRPDTPRRGAQRTMRVLRELAGQYADRIAIDIFGCTQQALEKHNLARDFAFENHGVLTREQVADLLRRSHIFLDLSDYQAFGRTAAEAMACGCVVFVTHRGGADEFCADGENGFLVDVHDEPSVVSNVSRLIENATARQLVVDGAVATAARYSATSAALSEIAIFFEHKREPLAKSSARPAITIVTSPGGNGRMPGHSTYTRIIRPYIHPRIVSNFDVRVAQTLPEGPGTILLDRDVLFDAAPEYLAALRELRRRGAKLVLELDDAITPVAKILRLLREVDALIVSSEILAETLKPWCRQVVVVESYLDDDLWRLSEGPKPATQRDSVKIGFHGWQLGLDELRLVQQAAAKIKAAYGERVQFEAITPGDAAIPAPWRPIAIPQRDYPAVVSWLGSALDWDIVVLPLRDEASNLARSAVSFLEVSAIRVPAVCSAIGPYRTAVRSGENGLLVTNDDQAWYAALSELIDDASRRKSLADRAFTDLVRDYTLNRGSTKLAHALQSLSGRALN
jgi:glycosyltransferase involved in cell wall biosynthesis